jgi:tellurite resistance protein TerC
VIALADISSAPWVVFIVAVLFFVALDLGVFHRRAREVKFTEALFWTTIWFGCAMGFAFWVAPAMVSSWSRQDTIKFITGYLLELSLSMDNVFVIALLFAYFRVPPALQHRVLFWGILGALVMRGVLIGAGVVVIREFEWVLYAMGAFLVLSGVKMLVAGEEEVHPERNIILRLVRTIYPVSTSFDGQRFFTLQGGRRALTPLALVLVCVETTDLVFAIDSIPAIFGVTSNGFIVFTSNVFAILGLRSLYFVLAGAMGHFRYLKIGLSMVLVFIGAKMLLDPHELPAKWYQLELSTSFSLIIVGGILLSSVLASLSVAWCEARRQHKP